MATTTTASHGRRATHDAKAGKRNLADGKARGSTAAPDNLVGGRERYGDQTPEQRQASARQAQEGSVGGQDSRDQGYVDPSVPPARQATTQKATTPEASKARPGFGTGRNEFDVDSQSEHAAPEGYESDTRDNFSRMYTDHLRKQREQSPTDPNRSDGPPTEPRR